MVDSNESNGEVQKSFRSYKFQFYFEGDMGHVGLPGMPGYPGLKVKIIKISMFSAWENSLFS